MARLFQDQVLMVAPASPMLVLANEVIVAKIHQGHDSMVTLRPVDSRICLVDSETALGPKLR